MFQAHVLVSNMEEPLIGDLGLSRVRGVSVRRRIVMLTKYLRSCYIVIVA